MFAINVAANGIILFFLWLSSIPLHVCHIFFIHSSVDGCLGCFQVLAIVDGAAVNTGASLLLTSSLVMPMQVVCPTL